ncbi:hypothetical protein [Alphaproteobacteria bacterium endosymbiont of Tiliacea citrago]|uniref:hypothetical protein n=1 Tax=Alphaproteobacteria bacterium endosymbiont of Tiliacea citrago TaxID=3077944 RepID=UPI00313ABE04
MKKVSLNFRSVFYLFQLYSPQGQKNNEYKEHTTRQINIEEQEEEIKQQKKFLKRKKKAFLLWKTHLESLENQIKKKKNILEAIINDLALQKTSLNALTSYLEEKKNNVDPMEKKQTQRKKGWKQKENIYLFGINV